MAGSIRKLSDGLYEISYFAGRDAQGKQHRKYQRIKGTKKEAEARLAQLIAGLSTGAIVASDKQTVAQFMDRWLEEIRTGVAEKTHKWYAMNVRLYINPRIGGIQLSKLTPMRLQALYRELLESGRTAETATGKEGEGLPAVTVHGIHRTLSSALGRAVKWGLIPRNPAENAEKPRRERIEHSILTAEQGAALVESAREVGRSSLFLAALTTGMRRGELLGLRWTDVDLQNDVLYVRQQLSKKKVGENEYKEPKARQARSVPIVAPLHDALVERWEAEKLERLRPDFRNYDLVWHTPEGEPITPRNLDRQLKRCLERAKLPDVRFHDLRHSCASLLLYKGVELKVVSEILGHSQLAITADLYTHVLPAMTRPALNLVGEAFEAAQKTPKTEAANPQE